VNIDVYGVSKKFILATFLQIWTQKWCKGRFQIFW